MSVAWHHARRRSLHLSELPHEAQLGAVAVVVLRLGVGLARLVDERQLRAEAEHGEGAVEDGKNT